MHNFNQEIPKTPLKPSSPKPHSSSTMEHPRNTQMIRTPTHHQNGVKFRSLPPSFSTHQQETSFGLAPVDQSLSNVFSFLSLSPANFSDAPPFHPETHGGRIGFGGPVPFTVDPYHLQRLSSSRFDIDSQKSLMSSKNFPKLKVQRSDSDEKHLNICYNNSNPYGFLSKWSLKELEGRIYALAKDQNGCRVLQAMFERPTMEDVQIVLSEVVDGISDLMKDQFGNYLVQKLVTLCNDDQKLEIILSLIKVPTNIILVCMNQHGTRAVQTLLENLKDPNQVKLVMNALHHGAARLANDPNGHHVIQYCLLHFHSHINKPILTEIADACFKVATDRSGCCVLQACLEHTRGEVRTRLVAEIMAISVPLAEDPFGNYVLQHMIELNIPEFTFLLVRQLQGNFASLSCNKYASNVVEKCLNESGEHVSTQIILELIRSPNPSLLLVDPYANFVIQSALKVSKGRKMHKDTNFKDHLFVFLEFRDQMDIKYELLVDPHVNFVIESLLKVSKGFVHECLRVLISKNVSSMRSNLYGKKILERLEKRRVNLG